MRVSPSFARVAALVALAAASSAATALPAGATDSTSLSFVFASTLETKLTVTESLTFPLLAGAGPLTSGNNLLLEVSGEVSPVSLNATCNAAFTPVAFLVFSTGGGVGTGWNIPIADGLRMNSGAALADGSYTGSRELTDESFGGAVWYWQGGGTFQFDFAAIVPGKWNHAVIQTYHGVKYRAYTGAASGKTWLWEADEGENVNGWSYYGNCFAGYQMPVGPDLVGMLVENDTRLYGTSGGDYWGEAVPKWTWGPLVNVTFRRDAEGNSLSSLAFLAQWQHLRTFTRDTADYDYFRARELVGGDPYRVAFYRAAVIYSQKLR